jgi:hypothetical protein
VTAPALAHTSSQGHRVYTWAGRAYPSVTAVLAGGVPKPALPRWAATTAAHYAITHRDRLATLPARAAIAEASSAPWAQAAAAAHLGDQVHAAVAAHATGRPRPPLPPEAAPFLAAFDAFVAEQRPGWLASEQTVYSCRYGYAGTLDAIATLHGRVVLLDAKTGRGVYPEVALQLAAYAHADFAAHPDNTQTPLPAIQAGAVLHLRPHGYQLLAVPIGRAVLEAFLAALAVFRFTTELAPHLLPAPEPDRPCHRGRIS